MNPNNFTTLLFDSPSHFNVRAYAALIITQFLYLFHVTKIIFFSAAYMEARLLESKVVP